MSRRDQGCSTVRSSAISIVLILGCVSLAASQMNPYDYDDGDYPYGDYGMGNPGGPPATQSLARHIKGIVDLDEITFDKVVGTRGHYFVTFYDPSDTSQAEVGKTLEDVADALGEHLTLTLAKLDVSGEGSAVMKSRFDNRDTPFHLLFGSDTMNPVEYSEDSPDAEGDASKQLTAWLLDHTGSPLQLPAFGDLVISFMKDQGSRENLLESAKSKMGDLTAAEAAIGKWYLKTMNHIVKKGDDYLEKEHARLANMLNDNASLKQEKVKEFKQRQGVISVFMSGRPLA